MYRESFSFGLGRRISLCGGLFHDVACTVLSSVGIPFHDVGPGPRSPVLPPRLHSAFPGPGAQGINILEFRVWSHVSGPVGNPIALIKDPSLVLVDSKGVINTTGADYQQKCYWSYWTVIGLDI